MKTVFGKYLLVSPGRRRDADLGEIGMRVSELRAHDGRRHGCSVLTFGVSLVCPMLPETGLYLAWWLWSHWPLPRISTLMPPSGNLQPPNRLIPGSQELPTYLHSWDPDRAHWWLLLDHQSSLFLWMFFRVAVYSTIPHSSQKSICFLGVHRTHLLLYFIFHEDTKRGNPIGQLQCLSQCKPH